MTWWNVSTLHTSISLFNPHLHELSSAPSLYQEKNRFKTVSFVNWSCSSKSSIYLQLVRVRMHILAILEKLE